LTFRARRDISMVKLVPATGRYERWEQRDAKILQKPINDFLEEGIETSDIKSVIEKDYE